MAPIGFYPVGLAILLFRAADKLPKLARGLGKSLGEFKKAKEDFEKEVHAAANEPKKRSPDEQNPFSGNVPAPVTPCRHDYFGVTS